MSRTSSNFGPVGQQTLRLSVLERLKIPHILIIENMV